MERNYKLQKESWKIFEEDTKNLWFPGNLYQCYHETPDYRFGYSNFNEDLLKPDFGFSISNTGSSFWIECKLRRISLNKTTVWLFKSGQRERYSQHDNVFIFIKLLQKENVKYYCVPLFKLSSNSIELKQLGQYRIWQTDFIRPGLIKKYVC